MLPKSFESSDCGFRFLIENIINQDTIFQNMLGIFTENTSIELISYFSDFIYFFSSFNLFSEIGIHSTYFFDYILVTRKDKYSPKKPPKSLRI